jgi:hypothetical protein
MRVRGDPEGNYTTAIRSLLDALNGRQLNQG